MRFTAPDQWCAIPKLASIGASRLIVMTLACSRKAVRPADVPPRARIWAELYERASADSVVPRTSLFSTIYAKACSSPTSTIPLSIRSIAMCSLTTVRSPCLVAFKIPILRTKSNVDRFRVVADACKFLHKVKPVPDAWRYSMIHLSDAACLSCVAGKRKQL